jgi:hypothetical protein
MRHGRPLYLLTGSGCSLDKRNKKYLSLYILMARPPWLAREAKKAEKLIFKVKLLEPLWRRKECAQDSVKWRAVTKTGYELKDLA